MNKTMRKFRVPLLALTLGAALAIGGCSDSSTKTSAVANPNPHAFQPVGTIQGNLVDAVTQQPIVGAVIDIGVAKATTSTTGQYTLNNVPATEDKANNTIHGQYSVTIDLTKVTSPVAMAQKAKDPTGGPYYPDYAYEEAEVEFTSLQDAGAAAADNAGNSASTTNATNHDTPVDHLVGNAQFQVGKLAAAITGVVVNKKNLTPVGPGFTVNLVSQGSWNSATGAGGNVVQTATTDDNGAFSFTGVESMQDFSITAWNADKSLTTYGCYSSNGLDVTAPADGQTLTLMAQREDSQRDGILGPPVMVDSPDNVSPILLSVSPAKGSDLAPQADQTITFTFSEPIKQNTYTQGLTASATGGIYYDVWVYYESKAGNIAHTISWSDDDTQLIVTIAQTASSGYYTVDISDAISGLKDASGNSVASLGPANGYYFTTNGGLTPEQPTGLTVANSANVDYNGPAYLTWAPASGSKSYNVYCAPVEVWGSTTQTGQYSVVANPSAAAVKLQGDLDLVANQTSLLTEQDVSLNLDCYVVGVNSDGIEGPASDHVTVKDNVAPEATSNNFPFSWQLPEDGQSSTHTVTIQFSEPMAKGNLQNKSLYQIAPTGNALATDVVPTVTNVVYDGNYKTATVTLKLTNPANTPDTDTYSGAWALTIGSDFTDIAGNPLASTTFDNTPYELRDLPTLPVTYVNQGQIDYDSLDDNNIAPQLNWTPYTGAKSYRAYCQRFEAWPDGSRSVDQGVDFSQYTGGDTAATLNAIPFTWGQLLENGNIALQWDCEVVAYDVNYNPIALSPIFTVKDDVNPEITNVNPAFGGSPLPNPGETATYHIYLNFSEPMSEATVADPSWAASADGTTSTIGPYTLTQNAGAAATDVVPTLLSATQTSTNTVDLKVQIASAADGSSTYTGDWTLTTDTTQVTDVAGNTLVSDDNSTYDNGIPILPANLTLSNATKVGYSQGVAPKLQWSLYPSPAELYVTRYYRNAGDANVTFDANFYIGTDAETTFTDGGFNDLLFDQPNGIPQAFMKARTYYYQVYVYDLPGGNLVGRTLLLPMRDTVAPEIASVNAAAVVLPPNDDTAYLYPVYVTFNEPMNTVDLKTTANFTVAPTAGQTPAATDIVPVVDHVDWNFNGTDATVWVRLTNPTAGEGSPPVDTNTLFTKWSLTVSVVHDVSGNVISPDADQWAADGATFPTGVTANPY